MFRSDEERYAMRLPPRPEGRRDKLLTVLTLAIAVAASSFFTWGSLSIEDMRLFVSAFVFCLVFIVVLKEALHAMIWPKALLLALAVAAIMAIAVFLHPPVP